MRVRAPLTLFLAGEVLAIPLISPLLTKPKYIPASQTTAENEATELPPQDLLVHQKRGMSPSAIAGLVATIFLIGMPSFITVMGPYPPVAARRDLGEQHSARHATNTTSSAEPLGDDDELVVPQDVANTTFEDKDHHMLAKRFSTGAKAALASVLTAVGLAGAFGLWGAGNFTPSWGWGPFLGPLPPLPPVKKRDLTEQDEGQDVYNQLMERARKVFDAVEEKLTPAQVDSLEKLAKEPLFAGFDHLVESLLPGGLESLESKQPDEAVLHLIEMLGLPFFLQDKAEEENKKEG